MSSFGVEYAIESIVKSINGNIYFNVISAVIGMVSFVQEAMERYREKTWRKLLLESVLVCLALIVLCRICSIFPAVFIVALLVWAMTFYRRKRDSCNISEHIADQSDEQLKDVLTDQVMTYKPKIIDISSSAFKNAEKCLAEKLPKAAIGYLNNCREKEKSQLRFVTRYVDALIMLENYEGALTKLNDLTAKQINKKKRYKSVMVRKAACYYSLNRYMEELDCYDKIIASNYKPEKYYFYRGKIKTRLLGKDSYVKEAEEIIFQTYGSKQGIVESAMADFDKSLSYGDKYKAKILSYRGSCYFHLQEQEKALDLFYESESLREHFENNYVYFGIYYYEAKKYDVAQTYFENAILYGTMDEVPHLYLARISFQEKVYDKAILHAAKALSIFPKLDECYGIQGDCYKKKNMYEDAIACYTKAIDLKPKEDYFQSRATCYYNKINPAYKKAYDDIQQALKINDSGDYCIKEMLYRSKMDRQEGKIEKEELERLLQPYMGKAKYYNDIGLIFEHYEYVDEAENYYRKEIEHEKDSSTACYNLARILRANGRIEEALRYAEKAVDLDPMDIKYLNLIDNCYKDLGSAGGDIEIQLKITSIKEKYMKINKENGDAVYLLGKYYSAEQYYRAALEYMPQVPAVLNNLACALYYQERCKEAIVSLQRAKTREARPSHLVCFNLGNCYLRVGDEKSALSNYQTALNLCVEFDFAKQMLECMDPSRIKMMIIQ